MADPVEELLNLDSWPLPPPSASSSSSDDPFLVGFIIANAVGLQHYTGTINGREMVGLVRDPLNAYDENAIKVINIRSQQVGFIERAAAKVLAPIIDSNLIKVQGIVPKASPRANRYKMPCQVHIFARSEDFEAVKLAVSDGGFQLLSENNTTSATVKQTRDMQDGKSVEEIFKLLEEQIGQSGASGELEPPKDVIKSELFSHQKEGLGWLVQRENSCDLPPFWEVKDGAYCNVLTNHLTDERPEPFWGGIFADDMGLGKTLTLLSLIAFDKFCIDSPPSVDNATAGDASGLGEEKPIVISGKGSKRGRSSRTNLSKKRQRTESTEVPDTRGKSVCHTTPLNNLCSKSTLVVCPPSVFSAWVTQLGEHTVPGKLKVYMYYGDRVKDANKLCEYDIILTTYSIISTEDAWQDSPLKKIEWRRIILDEAHTIKNVKARQSQAVTKLNAARRWVVTGTPIQNSSLDIFSLLAFLRFEPLSNKDCWNNLIAKPLASGDEKGVSWLQVLMAAIALRRTKDKALVTLPSKFVETLVIELSDEERDVYDKMEAEARRVIQHYISGESFTRKYSTVLSILVRLRQVCNALALCPPDIRDLLPVLEDVSNNPKLLEKMLSVLQEGEDLDCPICLSSPNHPVITCCAHIFCQACILKAIRRPAAGCPLCRHPLSDSDLFSAPSKPSETDDVMCSSSNLSSKVSALIKSLSETRMQSPTTKSVVFSQFRKMLLLLEEPLKAAGFKVLRLDGSMNANKRAKIVKEFDVPTPDGATILLASLKACGAGINLTAASRVYLLEPWWNPAVEEQAMDRVHRIGQTQDVRIVRFIAKNTIEERILELQECKKLLARKAFGKRGSQEQRDMSREDLISLMQL